MTDPFVGTLTFFRVYSGVHRAPARTSSTRPRGRRSASAASSRCTPTSARRSRRSTPATSPPPSACATRRTGDTLCDENKPIVLESIEFPDPVISIAIEPKTKADQEQPRRRRCRSSPPRIRRSASHTDTETGQTIISGMGELHLEIIVDRLLREFKVDANVGKPQVAYRETIRKTVEHEAQVRPPDRRPRPVRPRRASRSSRCAPGAGFEFVDGTKGGVDPARVHPGRREGRARGASSAACSPATRWSTSRSTLIDGSYHDVDSSEIAFKIAGSMAFKEATAQGVARSSSSRSWRSRSSRPRSSWATSSATSTAAAAGSRAWSRAAARR